MYCSIEEAWPNYPQNNIINRNNDSPSINNINKNNKNNDLYSISKKEYEEYQQFLKAKQEQEQEQEQEQNKEQRQIIKRQEQEQRQIIKRQEQEQRQPYYRQSYDNSIEHFVDSKMNNNNNLDYDEIKCDYILDHIHKCDKCLKKVYMKYNCVGNRNNNIFNMLDKNQKEVLSIVLTGILVILLLQLFAGKEN